MKRGQRKLIRAPCLVPSQAFCPGVQTPPPGLVATPDWQPGMKNWFMNWLGGSSAYTMGGGPVSTGASTAASARVEPLVTEDPPEEDVPPEPLEPPVDEPPIDEPPIDELPVEKPPVDKPPVDKPSLEEAPIPPEAPPVAGAPPDPTKPPLADEVPLFDETPVPEEPPLAVVPPELRAPAVAVAPAVPVEVLASTDCAPVLAQGPAPDQSTSALAARASRMQIAGGAPSSTRLGCGLEAEKTGERNMPRLRTTGIRQG